MTRNAPLTDDVFARLERRQSRMVESKAEKRAARSDPPDEGPLEWRWQHSPDDASGIQRASEQVPDVDGNIGHPYKARDVVQVLRSNGTISEAAEKAVRTFQSWFDAAQLVGYQSPDLTRVLGSTRGGRAEPARVLDARDEVDAALKHLGGRTTPVSEAAWHVLGLGKDIKTFAQHCQLGNGKSITQQTARGLVNAACCALAGHYGT